jgi:hypothetical protein
MYGVRHFRLRHSSLEYHGDIVLYLKEKTGVNAADTLNAYREGKPQVC